MTAGERPGDRGDGGGERVSDEELLRWADGIAKARGRVQAALDVSLNYRTLARALDEQALTRVAREALLEAHRAGSAAHEAEGTGETAEDLARRVEATEAQLADALAALDRERERADGLERRLESLEGQAAEPGVEMPAGTPTGEPPNRELATAQKADAEGSATTSEVRLSSGSQWAGVVTLEPLEGEDAALGEAAALVAEWRRLRGGDALRGSAVDRARAEERRWELEVALVGEHGLALPPETEPLHPSRRDDQLRWRRATLGRARASRARAERLRLLRRVFTLGLWWR